MIFRLYKNFIRRFRASIKHWSPKKDKDYHDNIFAGQDYDPFCDSYPGYITIRRFADLTAPYLRNVNKALDLGCGSGEITVELAKRFPEISFIGIDHSEAGVRRAKNNTESLNLNNVSFLSADIESYRPEPNADIVLMFDSFHHLTNPKRFVNRFREFSSRFLLIEPQGDWKGSWKKNIDFDWLILELEKIRARIAYLLGEKDPSHNGPSKELPSHQEMPIEHRYTMEDFETFFSGYGLKIHGTISGLDVYPPDSLLQSPSRDYFGRLAYDLYKEVDGRLYDHNLDLLSKHWVIYAEKGKKFEKRKLPAKLPDQLGIIKTKGPYDVDYIHFRGAQTAKAKDTVKAEVRLRNHSFRIWTSTDIERPDYISYHWLSKKEEVLVHDGERSPLPHPIAPDEECDVSIHIKMPDRPGRYLLAIDLVRENTTWFSDAGSPSLRIPFHIR